MDFIVNMFNKGGPVMWPLLVCSIVSVTISVERAIFWFRERSAANDVFVKRALEGVERGSREVVVEELYRHKNYLSRIMSEGLRQCEHGLSEVMQMVACREVERMRAGLPVLDTIITMAPLLGILGTVSGIIESFNLLGAGGIEDPRAVTAGIAQALITTASGLTVALISLVPYNYFVARIQKAAKEMEIIATELEIVFRKSSSGR